MSGCWKTVVSIEALDERLGARDEERPLAIVDVRVVLADRAAGHAAYVEGHIPGAAYADLERDLSGPHTSGAGRHPWPDEAGFAVTLGRLGITPATQVVVYDAAGGALAAARLWFLLRSWGHECVAVLDGGWSAWLEAGNRVVTGEETPAHARPYTGAFDRDRLLDAAQTEAAIRSGSLLVDARAAERFRGDIEPLDRKAGHIPGSVNRPFAENLSSGRFKDPTRLRAEFESLLGGRSAGELVASCGSGVTACHNLLAMEHAGMPGGRLFTGSWSGWIEDDSHAIATG